MNSFNEDDVQIYRMDSENGYSVKMVTKHYVVTLLSSYDKSSEGKAWRLGNYVNGLGEEVDCRIMYANASCWKRIV